MKKLFFLISMFCTLFMLHGQNKQATLYFIRPDNFAGKLMDLRILLNGNEIGTIANGSKFEYQTDFQGQAKIILRAPGSPPKSLTLTIDKGQKYYFRVGFNALGKFIKQINSAELNTDIPENKDVVVNEPKNVVVSKDTKGPSITVTNPKVARGFKLSQTNDEIKITGKVIDESGIFKLTVNGNTIPVDENGNFQSMLALKPGENAVKILASDTQENTSEFSFIVECKAKAVVSNEVVVNTEIVKPGEKRIALIIGNADYKSAPLRNPVNDATLMNTELKKLGFDVSIYKNASQNQMRQAISNFGEQLAKDKNTVGLFYYAGHGIQIKGKNYLIPTDAKIEKEPDVEVYCVDLDGLLANMEYAANNMNIIILDACRNNPFGRGFRSQAGDGLATVNAPVGTIIAYATAPGSVAADGDGQNGLYTQEFAKACAIPDLKIEDVFKKVRTQVKTISEGKQIPWENSSIEGDFYFIRKK